MLWDPNLEAKSDSKPVRCPGAWLSSVCVPYILRKQHEHGTGNEVWLDLCPPPFRRPTEGLEAALNPGGLCCRRRRASMIEANVSKDEARSLPE